jgi:ADP-ribosylglycohydrolase
LESENFEDAIRNVISIGGDSDTLAAITGSIAEAAYGIPEDIKNKAISYLDNEIKEVYNSWINFLDSKKLIFKKGEIKWKII